MRRLSEIYDSARVNIPLRAFPERDALPTWEELDERVRSELDMLQERIFSALHGDQLLLANHHRVIGEFNRGVRQSILADPGEPPPRDDALSRSPFEWGRVVGLQAKSRDRAGAPLVRQFTTVTHLLAFEFRQLNLACARPLDFLMRNVGPEHAEEFGELVFALPVLLNYQRALTARIVDGAGFSFAAYEMSKPVSPSHLDLLAHGIVELFDPDPRNWTRVAANFGLATRPFTDGTTLQGEDFRAPVQAAEVVAARPIAARTVIRRQMERIELAREWVGSDVSTIDVDAAEADAPVTLWDVYQRTPAATIRGQGSYFADVVAKDIVGQLSEHVERSLAPDDTRLAYLHRHLPAFVRGFDARSDCVVDIRALDSIRFGSQLSDALRRFHDGGLFVGGVAEALEELSASVREMQHAVDDYPAFVRATLLATDETPLARELHALFERFPNLVVEMFGENTQFEFFSRTQIETRSAFDLVRRVLFHVVHAMQPNQGRDTERALLAAARATLRRLLDLGHGPVPADTPRPAPGRAAPIMNRGATAERGLETILAAAEQFEQEFETLTRVVRRIVVPLHMARMLARPQSSFRSAYLDVRRGAG